LIWLACWAWIACGGDVLHDGPWRIAGHEDGFCITGLEPALTEPKVVHGELVALNRNGVVYREDVSWYFLKFSAGEPRKLERPGEPFLRSKLEDVDGPAFLNASSLVVWQDGKWQVLGLDVFVEYKGLEPVPGSQHGLNLIFPQVFQASEGLLVTYQPKTGQLNRWKLPKLQPQNTEFERDRRAIFLGPKLAWLGAPKEEKVALAKPGSLTNLGDNASLDNLNKHSLAVPRQVGCWVLTFPSGLRDGLKSWDSGKLSLEAFYIRVDGNDKLHTLSHDLPKLPLEFDLRTSASGSPRLDVEPDFKVVAIYQSEWIAILSGKHLHTVSPVAGVSSHVLAQDPGLLSSLLRKGDDLMGMNAQGRWIKVVEGLF